MAISPDGKILINTSETTNMAHFIDTANARSSPMCWSMRVPALQNSSLTVPNCGIVGDRRLVSTSTGQTVVTDKINFNIPGLRREHPAVGIGITRDGKTASARSVRPTASPSSTARAIRSRSIFSSASGSGTWHSRGPKISACDMGYPTTLRDRRRRPKVIKKSRSASCPGHHDGQQ